MTPDGDTSRYISGFSLREGHRRVGRGDARAHQGAQEADEGVSRTWSTTSRSWSIGTSTIRRRCREATQTIDDVEVEEDAVFGVKKTAIKRNVPALVAREVGEARGGCAIGIPKVLNIWTTRAVLAHLPRDARHPEAERGVLRLHVGGDVARGRQVRLDRSLLPVEGRAGAHPQPALPPPRATSKKLNFIFFPCITHVPPGVNKVMDTASCPIVAGAPEVMKAAFTKETDFFAQRGIKYLDPAMTFTEPTLLKQPAVRRASARRSASPRTRTTSPCDQAWKAMRHRRRRDAGQGHARSSSRSRRRTASRS